MSKKSIAGHYHMPIGDVHHYAVGSPTGRLDYNKGPAIWSNRPVIIQNPCAQMGTRTTLDRMADSMFGEGEMCGRCAMTKLGKTHDPYKHARWKCQLCSTEWMGIEPGNDRRGAIAAQKRRTTR